MSGKLPAITLRKLISIYFEAVPASRSKTLQKRVDEAQTADDEAVRDVLGIKPAAAQGQRRGDNRAVPIGEAVTLLNIERCRQDLQCHGLHGKARPGADQLAASSWDRQSARVGRVAST